MSNNMKGGSGNRQIDDKIQKLIILIKKLKPLDKVDIDDETYNKLFSKFKTENLVKTKELWNIIYLKAWKNRIKKELEEYIDSIKGNLPLYLKDEEYNLLDENYKNKMSKEVGNFYYTKKYTEEEEKQIENTEKHNTQTLVNKIKDMKELQELTSDEVRLLEKYNKKALTNFEERKEYLGPLREENIIYVKKQTDGEKEAQLQKTDELINTKILQIIENNRGYITVDEMKLLYGTEYESMFRNYYNSSQSKYVFQYIPKILVPEY